jgi:uncharacterized protein YneF (UPF0154 family)
MDIIVIILGVLFGLAGGVLLTLLFIDSEPIENEDFLDKK